MTHAHVHLDLDRKLLEHPQALHIRRMRSAIWLYLVLASRSGGEVGDAELDLGTLSRTMGLSGGTLRSWLGLLRKHRYVRLRRDGDALWVSVRRAVAPPPAVLTPVPDRVFTVEKLERALGETGYRDGLEAAIETHDDDVIRPALAGALAVPTEEIRRSRTALFLYLLKRHAHSNPNENPRP